MVKKLVTRVMTLLGVVAILLTTLVIPVSAGESSSIPVSFGPSSYGKAKSYMYWSPATAYTSGEGWTWLNPAPPGPYRYCATVTSYTINGANQGGSSENCHENSTANNTVKSIKVNSSLSCVSGTTYNYAISSSHKMRNSSGQEWLTGTNHNQSLYCA